MRNEPVSETAQVEEFGRELQRLLEKRRREVAQGLIPGANRTWMLDELADMMDYDYLRRIARGDAKRPPKRGIVLEIAECLRCRTFERNQLLIAAGYAPVVDMTADQLNDALVEAADYLSYVPVPAFVITRSWWIPMWNAHAVTLWDMSDSDVEKLTRNGKNHVLRLLFDRDYPIYHRIPKDGNNSWDHAVRINIMAFRSSNVLCRYDHWYVSLIEEMLTLQDFARYWHDEHIMSGAPPHPKTGSTFPLYSTEIISRGQRFWVKGVHTSLGNLDYPLVVSYLPISDADRSAFQAIGIPTPENGWGALTSSEHCQRTRVWRAARPMSL